MSALFFPNVLRAIEKPETASEAEMECLTALSNHGRNLAEKFPALARAHRSNVCADMSQGEIIIRSLSMDPDELDESERELYADCYLVLADWVAGWNRSQIQGLAG